ncbi:integrin beta-1-binding protein [Plectosphaerella plurivora]|uniref:Integrin beta-1-binding protein n=1 Tax=Plectosphaerella plurivora TaxID=936078 RepID=A0A9P8V2E0_9PEZI|nr:integrin beta-1-binding protein [Plectosphaerella plurivora]
MAQKCVHQGCGKLYTDPEETCTYHPGPPIFHEGQKGWKCCKPRFLTFEEFLSIPPCTEGKHSTTDLPPKVEQKENQVDPALVDKLAAASVAPGRKPLAAPQTAPTPPPPPPESEDDDPSLEIPDGATCRRKTCGATYKRSAADREGESCVHHPGVPIFHEGSKGYSCCKRRVLEFDQFMKIEGCKTKDKHMFVGSGQKKGAAAGDGGEELLETVRTDFYQTPSSVIASYFLKKIVKDQAKVEFHENSVTLDLPTSDAPRPKRYRTEVPLFAPIDAEKSTFKVLGTKLELTLVKGDDSSWPVLRSDDRLTGEILQIGKAGRMAK